jgi:hypothetical protein
MSEQRRVLDDGIGWTTEVKKGALRPAGNPTPTPIAKGDVVTLVEPRVGLDVEPKSVVVETSSGQKLEVRERLLGPV